LNERTFFCPACEYSWSVSEGRVPRIRRADAPVAVEAAASWSPPTTRKSRLGELKERLAATLRHATTILDTSRSLYRLSRRRRELRRLSRAGLGLQ
jgi:hypothetical protein